MRIINDTLKSLKEQHRFRNIPSHRDAGVLDLSSNDYLSLAAHGEEYFQEFIRDLDFVSFSSSASRLLSGNQRYHLRLERLLSDLYGKDSLLFNSGYHANVGCIGALTFPSTLFLCDKLIHASIIDGLRISGSEFKRFPHNDIGKLKDILNKVMGNYENIVIVVEAIYSMDGDEAPLREIVALKDSFPGLMLYVDEAHSFGVRGKKGLGLSEELGIIDKIDVIIGTLGKAAASSGAFAICSEELKSLFVNSSRPFIFSTALPPVNAAWSEHMIRKIVSMEEERNKLAALSAWFRSSMEKLTGLENISSSQIIPLITGDAEEALRLAEILKGNGIIALPIRRPTVPPGGERIRFSLGANMDIEILQPVFDILKNEIRTYPQ